MEIFRLWIQEKDESKDASSHRFFCPQEKQLGKEGGGVAFLHVQLQERAKGR
ncbi:hypothetical protein [Anoxybacillus sp. KU2-6(11)]|uniref:hypothetical protein n=1 Tax=Anoxybacillus sp. KU2-6(11) TaxID=1535751 RepID=UPI000A612E2F|nr:hypothetical protein [Anoxybacillus sp. KU2-6(11)]